jgi:hypothetical protein
MQFKILPSLGKANQEWLDLIRRLKPEDQDLHFLPEYGNVYQLTYGYQPFLAFYGNEDCFTMQAFVKRPLNELLFLTEQKVTEPFFDIANPYGYGGPLCRCRTLQEGQQLFKEFNANLTDYCRRDQIASEFTSFHPLLDNQRYAAGTGLVEINPQKEIVYWDLTLSETELWQKMSRGHKSGINKAKRNAVRVEKVIINPVNLKVFKNLYHQTMIRHRAASRWFFPDDYFENLFFQLGPTRVSLFLAWLDTTPLASYFLIHDFQTVYYHFGGSDRQYYTLRPSNLLMWEAALWAKKSGFLRFHLGGGVSSSAVDSLFQYKSGFTDRRATLYSYQRIHNREIYDYLCSLKRSHERMKGENSTSDYFPLYRRK